LLVDLPVRFGDRVRAQDAFLILHRIALGKVRAYEFRVDGAVDHRMRHVDALGPEFAGHALCQCAQGVLGSGKGREAFAPAQARRGASDDDGAPSTRQHHLGCLTSHQEAAETGHLPNLVVDARGGFRDAKAHVGTNVEDGHLDGCDVALDAFHERDHLFFLACVAAESVGLSAFGRDLPDQGLELVGSASGHARDVAFTREAPGDGATCGVAGTDDEDGFLVSHGEAFLG
jgi:hypothetical protein